MKRAKIMLLAIAVVATVGGALAFKAQRFTTQNVYCATIPAGGSLTCTTVGVPFIRTIGAAVITPCSTWHNDIGLPVASTSSYYTTTTCGTPFLAKATTTNVE